MLDETTLPDTTSQPLVTFPELDRDFPHLPAGAADACLSRCLSRLQQLPVDESSPAWALRLGLTLPWLLTAALGHSPQVLDTLADRLAHWTMDRFLHSDAIAAEILVALAQHRPRTLAVASRTIVTRLVQGLQQRQALPAWTATLIGLLRQASNDPSAGAIVQATLSALPDWQSVLRRDAFEQALAGDDRADLLLLVGHFSLLSLVDPSQVPSQPLAQVLPQALAPTGPLPIAPDMRECVHLHLAHESIGLHWLLTPLGTQSIDALLGKASTLFAAPACERIRQEIVLSLARHAAIQQSALRGAEAALLICQLQHLVRTAPSGETPGAWAPVWTAVRQLAGQAKPRPSMATPATDRSRTVNSLLCPWGLAGRMEAVGWRLALLRQSGLALLDCLGQLVQQVPCSPNGQPLLARVLQVACASAQEHQQALVEMCRVQGLPLHAGASVYTRHLLQRARLLELTAAQEAGPHHEYPSEESILRQVASQLPPGVLMLGLFGHVHAELPMIELSADGALWLVAQVQASVGALPAGVPMDGVLQICTAFQDNLASALTPAQHQQWSAWLRTL